MSRLSHLSLCGRFSLQLLRAGHRGFVAKGVHRQCGWLGRMLLWWRMWKPGWMMVVMVMKIDVWGYHNLAELLILFGSNICFWGGGRWTSRKPCEAYRHHGLQRLYHQLVNRTFYEPVQPYYVQLRSLRDVAIKEQKRKATQPKIIVLSSLTHPHDLFPWIINLASWPHLP